MLIGAFLTAILVLTTALTITEPVDGATYNGNWLTVRAIVENDNELPDSLQYSLNGESVGQIPRLITDWYTYMQNDLHHGYSESPAPTDNTILWTAPVTGDYHEFASPVIVDGIVYQPSNLGTDSLYALNAATGTLIWKSWIGTNDDAVTVRDGFLYVSGDSLWCLNALTGERIWASGSANLFGGTPVVANDMVYCGRSAMEGGWMSQVCCLNAETGAPVWEETYTGCLGSCMVAWNNMLFIPLRKLVGTCPLLAVDACTGSVIWENTDSYHGYWDSSPVLVDSLIYISGMNGYTFAIHAITGTTIWQKMISSPICITATPAYHDGRLYFADQVDSFHCLDASTGSTIWSVPGSQHGSSAIADGIVFWGEDSDPVNYARVIAMSCETGEEVWSYTTAAHGIRSSPAITDGVVYIAGEDWNLYAFGTGLKYTYLDDLFAEIGSNELVVISFDDGVAAAADTINFIVTGTCINLEPSHHLNLCASPNPFHSSATISYKLSEPGFISIEIFDLCGRSISIIENSELPAGEHSTRWNARNRNGDTVSAGLYLCRIQSGGISETTGLCLLR